MPKQKKKLHIFMQLGRKIAVIAWLARAAAIPQRGSSTFLSNRPAFSGFDDFAYGMI